MPLTARQWEESLRQPALCELLPVRDYLDNCVIRSNGSFVAGYETAGLNTFFHSDETRNRTKEVLEALVRSLSERSMRMQVRYEVTEGYGDLTQRYLKEQSIENPVLQALDRERLCMWNSRQEQGEYLERRLHVYFIWNPDVHHQKSEFEWRKTRKKASKWSLSAVKCIERTVREHQDLLSEFESLLAGIQATLEATGMQPRRMTDQELFLEAKRALNPLASDRRPYRPSLGYESARSQIANVNIEDEQDDHLKIGGLLYSWISLKEMPDATFPGIMRELVSQEFPLVISAEIAIPDQNRIMRTYKRRLLRMQAAQRDIHGGFKINVEAQIAQEQLIQTLQEVVSSSLKVCQLSLVIGLHTSKPIRNSLAREEAEQILADRRQRILHSITRMNGARAIPETLAQKRIYIGTLPGMAEETKREQECLTLHAADLLPVELPWRGLSTPAILLETASRQMVPFSPFDVSLGDANMLLMAKSGGGKTFLAQLLLLMLGRMNAQVSILERGDSYRPLVELMGGRVIEIHLDSEETLNPWDLPVGERTPSKEKIAFLKNLTWHMIGDSPSSDQTLVDNVLSEAIARTYKRVGMRYSNPVPTFSDLRDELAQWQDEEKMQRTIDEAKLAAVKLRTWTEKGIYSKLFDRHTNIRIDNNWLFFNVEGLSSDAHLETAMSMLIANAMAERASGKSGQPSITVLDECWSLLDSPVLAPEVVQLFRTARKRNSSVWGISQTLEDFVGTWSEPRPHGPGIVKNSHTKLIAFAVYVRLQPPTVIRVDNDGNATIVGGTPVSGHSRGLIFATSLAESAPTEVEAKAVVRRFLDRYLNYTPDTVDRQMADALNMMTGNFRTLVLSRLRDDDTINKIQDDHIVTNFIIRTINAVPGSPLTFTAFGVKEIHRLRNKQETTDQIVGRYNVRLAMDRRTEFNPSGLLVAEFWEEQMLGDKNTGLAQADELSHEATGKNQ